MEGGSRFEALLSVYTLVLDLPLIFHFEMARILEF